ncbi:portal protein [Rhodococcus phage Reynauld]|uniref:Portal protein n=1 Tax=Rhodococcus phage Reynauld TaxID=3062845 RepID=A0ACD4UGV9_9CAUD|nr:portal protein [Rhodococcus phage Reynauld]
MTQLVDHKGQPIASAQFGRKPKSFPLVGELSQPWVNEGGSARRSFPLDNRLNFDTSLLTLEHYRMMREHYQINSSITVLTFMLHQLEWKVECDNIKVARHCEENLRDIWTRLVRALSQAFVFGFSPNAIQWENKGNRVVITKIKDLRPEDCRVRWKDVNAVQENKPPHVTPKAKIFDGIKQLDAKSDVPVDNSLWYPLLMENGDYYGKKLLKSAFQPWFFSSLIHYYSNRYFERFGEPVIMGRAPFDEKVDITGSGNPQQNGIQGNLLMMGAVNLVRNGSGVVLPNTRAMNGLTGVDNYEYTMEYLESQMRGADFERYLTRLDQEISLALFTPLLMMNTADGGSFNLGVVHTQMYLAMINAIAADWKEYIDKYILWPMARWNFGENAKIPKLRFRKLGALDSETGRALLTQLLASGNGDKSVKVDVEEAGQVLGLTLTEIAKIQEPLNPAPGEDPAPEDKGKPAAKRDTRVGRPEREGVGKGVNKKAALSLSVSIADRVSGQFCRALQDGVDAGDFTIDVGHHRQFEESDPLRDYSEFSESLTEVLAEYYESMMQSDNQIKSEIREVIRNIVAAEMGVSYAEAA